jgi:hypothetical protein
LLSPRGSREDTLMEPERIGGAVPQRVPQSVGGSLSHGR